MIWQFSLIFISYVIVTYKCYLYSVLKYRCIPTVSKSSSIQNVDALIMDSYYDLRVETLLDIGHYWA